jgi:hypothetical protein
MGLVKLMGLIVGATAAAALCSHLKEKGVLRVVEVVVTTTTTASLCVGVKTRMDHTYHHQ